MTTKQYETIVNLRMFKEISQRGLKVEELSQREIYKLKYEIALKLLVETGR